MGSPQGCTVRTASIGAVRRRDEIAGAGDLSEKGASQQACGGKKIDLDAAMKAHETKMVARRAMMRQRPEAHNSILDVLAEEQRERLRRGYRSGPRWE